MFSHEVDKGLTGLVKELDKVLGENKGSVGAVILLTEDRKGNTEKLLALAKDTGIANLALTINEKGKQGPDYLELNPEMKHTVLFYRDRKVESVHALKEITDKDSKALATTAAKLLKSATK